MKKIVFTLVLAMCGLVTAFCQVKVSNGYGQTLRVTINNQTATIPNNGIQAFSVTGSAVLIKCETANGDRKFEIVKAVPTSNLILISPADGADGQTSQVLRNPSGQIALIYKGSNPFKIFSSVGQGLEFFGTDTINYIATPKGQDLVIGIGLKQGENQAIWPYAEIRKRLVAGSTVCRITDADIKKMSTGGEGEMKKMKIRLTAKDYKIYFEPSSGEPISLGFNEISRAIEMPIGQFYIKISYTDPAGMFHSTVFVPKHVTMSDKHLDITEENLKNAVTLNW